MKTKTILILTAAAGVGYYLYTRKKAVPPAVVTVPAVQGWGAVPIDATVAVEPEPPIIVENYYMDDGGYGWNTAWPSYWGGGGGGRRHGGHGGHGHRGHHGGHHH
jgi:hypothetical protein